MGEWNKLRPRKNEKKIREHFQWAQLKLSLLKENRQFRSGYKNFKNAVSKNPDLKTEEVEKLLAFLELFVTKDIISDLTLAPVNDILSFLAPEKSLEDIMKSLESRMSGFRIYQFVEGLIEKSRITHANIGTLKGKKVEPFELVIKIDLRGDKTDLKKQLAAYVDDLYEAQEARIYFTKKHPEKYKRYLWGDTTPYRKRLTEAQTQLDVWAMCKQNKTFKEISKTLGKSEDTVKHIFYLAYEKIQGERYDKDRKRLEFSKIDKDDIMEKCLMCPRHKNDYPDCVSTCPSALAFINQDYIKRHWRERPMSEIENFENPNSFAGGIFT